ncbi:MAG TPA: glycosyltransferase [Pyrinomonadaceae bacterium]
MRILLAQPLGYLYTSGGAHKANRLLMEGLAARGHACRVLSPLSASESVKSRAELLAELAQRGAALRQTQDGGEGYSLNGVEVRVTQNYLHQCAVLAGQVREFRPDVVLVSEDTAHLMLGAALEADRTRVVYISHSPATLPFGPDTFCADEDKSRLLRQARGMIAVSDYLTSYIGRWGGIEAETIRFPVYGPGPYPDLGRFEGGRVTLVNPCPIKGRSIFLELARQLPEVEFAAVPTWGAVKEDFELIRDLPNVRVIPPSENIDDIFRQTRVLLAPSLWGEAFGQVVVEAMLRGIPVLASNVGGLPEAKLGVDFLLPVRPIERYEPLPGEQVKVAYIPVIPEQDVRPWVETLGQLVADAECYRRVSRQSREAGLKFVAGLGFAPFEDYFEGLARREGRTAFAEEAPSVAQGVSRESAGRRLVSELPADMRALLALKLKRNLAARAAHAGGESCRQI